MREIKFRGMPVDLNKWIYGYLFITKKSNPLKEKTSWIFNEYGKYKVKPETVGQYTNRKDKNGKRIYKDDNLQYGNSPVYTVTWETDRWKMCGRKNGNGFCVDIPDFMEIIGNIHEPEAKQ